MLRKSVCRFIPFVQLMSFAVAKPGVWEGGMQRCFGFPVLPEMGGLKCRAMADGEEVGGRVTEQLPQQLSSLHFSTREAGYRLCLVPA